MNENIKELIESLPDEGVDCKGKEWVRYKPTSSRFIDRTGEAYGRLTALFPVQEKEKGKTKTMWLCRCSCGNFIVVSGSDLKTRNTRSCGCLHTELSIHMNDKKREEIIGMRFGRLTVISFHGVKDSKSYFLCKCDCGNEIIASMTKLKSGNTKSCGCLQRDIMVNRYAQKREEMIGMRFGKLTVISFHGIKDEKAQFLCKCDCGNEVIVGSNQLKTGYVKSCGCLLKESPFHRYDKYRQEMIGKQFGYLKVLAFEKI